ncbi:MAG: hypothetical protein AAFO15_00255 [Pseudomonadota bacterium]
MQGDGKVAVDKCDEIVLDDNNLHEFDAIVGLEEFIDYQYNINSQVYEKQQLKSECQFHLYDRNTNSHWGIIHNLFIAIPKGIYIIKYTISMAPHRI